MRLRPFYPRKRKYQIKIIFKTASRKHMNDAERAIT